MEPGVLDMGLFIVLFSKSQQVVSLKFQVESNLSSTSFSRFTVIYFNVIFHYKTVLDVMKRATGYINRTVLVTNQMSAASQRRHLVCVIILHSLYIYVMHFVKYNNLSLAMLSPNASWTIMRACQMYKY